ncbi:MAG: YceI family protein [Sphingobacteriales bacterium JAD_PAG50586_3]|nr:MAG: YceI family protein [Sphingobacteriales bacterium JAD_PAG50586_3]
MKKLLFLASFSVLLYTAQAQVYVGKTVGVDFYSHTPVEDIKAKTKVMTSVIDFGSNTFTFKIPVKTFDFPNDLMEEHFNENYLESAKYPNATFNGKMVSASKVDVTKDGTYTVMAEGTLDIHGVKQERKITATLTVKDGKVKIDAKFNVHLADHKVDVPTIVMSKIAEDIAVTVVVNLEKH